MTWALRRDDCRLGAVRPCVTAADVLRSAVAGKTVTNLEHDCWLRMRLLVNTCRVLFTAVRCLIVEQVYVRNWLSIN